MNRFPLPCCFSCSASVAGRGIDLSLGRRCLHPRPIPVGEAMISIPRLALAIALSIQPAAAQKTAPAHAPAPASAQPGQPAMTISVVTLTLLIKGAVLALHQANLTGNYSVVRDLGTPIFRETFDQVRLTDTFANLRNRKIDLSPALVLAPNLTKNPELNGNKELVLIGDFATQPLRIHFELAFLYLDGSWRLAGIAVDAVPADARQVQAAATPPAQPTVSSQIVSKKSNKLRW